MERLEIDGLRALLAIEAQGGVTRAAEQMALSQSAVSHKIRRLEQSLDCQLLARKAGGPLFTDAGLRLLDYARRMIDLHDEALAALAKKPLAGTIQLGMTEDTTTSEIARILGRFTRLFPEIKVTTRTSQSLNVQAWLKAGELDLAVMQVFSNEVQPGDMVLFEDSLHWVKAHDFALNPDAPLPFLSFDANCFYKEWAFQHGQSLGHRLEKVLECPSASGIQSAVRAGLGIAMLNGLHLTKDIEVIEGVFPAPPGLTFIARTREKTPTEPVKALMAEIRREVQSAVPLRVAS